MNYTKIKTALTFSILTFSFLINTCWSQNNTITECGTTINSSQLPYLLQMNKKWVESKKNFSQVKAYGGTTYFVPIQVHIVRNSQGVGGASLSRVLKGLEMLNNNYIEASVQFYQCSPINYIDDDYYYDFNASDRPSLEAAHSLSNVINLYIFNSITSGNSQTGGFTFMPSGPDFIALAKWTLPFGATLTHEMGHYLGLYHTHQTNFGNEAVNGSDCATEGDLICDTPADPLISEGSNLNANGCIYTGTETDENGDFYSPLVTNFMSYAGHECRVHFTEEQYDKILWTLINERNYLACTAPPLESFFYVNEEENCSSSKLFTFYNASTGNPTSYQWNFGDGQSSSIESPSYSYSNNGIYDVSLTISDGSNQSTYTQKVTVGAVSLPYYNDFENGASSLDQFTKRITYRNEISVNPNAAESGSFGLLFDGIDEGMVPTFKPPSSQNAFDTLQNMLFQSSAKLCVDGTNYTNLQLEFDIKQLIKNSAEFTNFRITVNDQIIGNIYQTNSDDTQFYHETIDLSLFDGQVFTLGFEGSHKNDIDKSGTGQGTATLLDNISITGNLDVSDISELNIIDMKIYPNPTKDLLQLQASSRNSGLANIDILNSIGEIIMSKKVPLNKGINTLPIPVNNLSKGMYEIRINIQNESHVKSFIVTE